MQIFILQDCYIIDSRSNAGMYVWMGRRSSDELRQYAVYISELFHGTLNYPYQTPVSNWMTSVNRLGLFELKYVQTDGTGKI